MDLTPLEHYPYVLSCNNHGVREKPSVQASHNSQLAACPIVSHHIQSQTNAYPITFLSLDMFSRVCYLRKSYNLIS